MYTIHLDILGTILDFQCIADLYSFCPQHIKEKSPIKTGGNG